ACGRRVGELEVGELGVSGLEVLIKRPCQEQQAREVGLASAVDHVHRRTAERREAYLVGCAELRGTCLGCRSREAHCARSGRTEPERSDPARTERSSAERTAHARKLP